MRLCMFHPVDHPMERGWVGRIEGKHVIHLAAQTLQSFFTGGGSAREHAVYPLDGVTFLAPVLHPPAVRIFESQRSFEFANPAAIVSPGATVPSDNSSQGPLTLFPRMAAIVGAGGELAGYTLLADWRRPEIEPPKDRDFALGLGPIVVTGDELAPDELEASIREDGRERARGAFGPFDWGRALSFAEEGTTLCPGDLLVGPSLGAVEGISESRLVELDVEAMGVLSFRIGPRS